MLRYLCLARATQGSGLNRGARRPSPFGPITPFADVQHGVDVSEISAEQRPELVQHKRSGLICKSASSLPKSQRRGVTRTRKFVRVSRIKAARLDMISDCVGRWLTNLAVLIWQRFSAGWRYKGAISRNGGCMRTFASVLSMRRLIFVVAVCAVSFGGLTAPSSAAELRRARVSQTNTEFRHTQVSGAKRAKTPRRYWNWRDRCAWAGYYCLYAWHGYVFYYPWDDRAYTYGY